MTQITSETAQLVAYQVGRVYALKTKHFSLEKADARLNLLCAKLTMQRSSRPYAMPRKLLRETAEVGGPRWRIGWGGLS
jgi:hypothetical protein